MSKSWSSTGRVMLLKPLVRVVAQGFCGRLHGGIDGGRWRWFVSQEVFGVRLRGDTDTGEDVAELEVVGLYHEDTVFVLVVSLEVPSARCTGARREGVLRVGLASHRAAEHLDTHLEECHCPVVGAGNLDTFPRAL